MKKLLLFLVLMSNESFAKFEIRYEVKYPNNEIKLFSVSENKQKIKISGFDCTIIKDPSNYDEEKTMKIFLLCSKDEASFVVGFACGSTTFFESLGIKDKELIKIINKDHPVAFSSENKKHKKTEESKITFKCEY